LQSPAETARAKSKRKAVAGVLAAIILFAMIFTVGSGFFLFVDQSAHSADQSNIARANDQLQAGQEKLLVTAGIASATDHGSNPCANCMWVRANNTGGVSSSIIDIYVTCVSDCDPHESGQLLSNSKASPGSHFLKQNPDLNVTLPISLAIGASTKYLTSCPSKGCTADITISKAALNYSNGEYVVVSLLTSAGNVFSAQYPPPANPVTTVVTVKSVTTHVTLTQVGGGPQLSVQMKATTVVGATQTLSCSDGCITLTATVFNFAPWSANNVSISLNEPYASGTASVSAYSSCSPHSLNIPVGENRSFSCRFSASTGAIGGFVSFSGHASGTLNTVFVTSADSLSNSIEVGGIASVTTQGAFAANFYLLKYSSCTQSSATQHAFNGTCIRNASPPLSNLPSGSFLAAGSNYYTAFYVQITNAFNTTLPITQYSYLFGDPDISGELFYFLAGSYSSSAAPQGVYYPNYPSSGAPTLTAYPSDCSVVDPKTNVPIDSNCLYVEPGQTVTLTIAACGYSSSSWAWGGQQDASLFDSGSTKCTMTPPDFTVPEGTSLGIVVSFFYKNNTYSQMMPFEGQALLRSTSTAVNCAPSKVVGGSTKCTATLTDTDGTPSQPFLTTPTGNVTFSDANENGSFSSASCTLNTGITSIRTESPMTGPIGTTITLTGANFASLSTITIDFNGAKVATVPATVTTDAAGAFTATFSVPSSPTGPQTVTATDASANTATAMFTVTTTEPTSSMTLSPMQGPVGTTVTVAGVGFASLSTITIKFNGAAQTTTPATVTTDASGAFNATFSVPSSPTGPQTITATDASANTATATFTVIPSECSVTYTPVAGILGMAKVQATYAGDSYHMGSSGTTTITLLDPTTTAISCIPISFPLGSTSQCTATLAGFVKSVNGEQIGWSRIGGTGNVSFSSYSCVLSGAACQVNVTGLRSGSSIIQASYAGDSNFNAASSGNATLTISLSMTLKPTSGPVGTSVAVTGAGFTPSSTITITFNGVKVTTIPATVDTSTLGAFTATFVVPSSIAGNKTVTATDASSNTASATFTVTPSIALSPTSGLVSTKVTVMGAGFAPTSTVTIAFNGLAQTTSPTAVTTSALGAFNATFIVPSSIAGAQVVTATDASANTASTRFTVTSSITLKPIHGPVGTTVTVTGAGLAPSSIVTIAFNGAAQTTSPATVTTDASGAFTSTFVIPSTASAGAQIVKATDASGNSASATFTVTIPTISLSPSQGPAGTTVAVTGANFVPNSTITVKFNGATVTTVPATVTSSPSGAFTSTSFVVPSTASAGGKTVIAMDATSNSASATFTVTTPAISLSPIRGLYGTNVTVAGSGFSIGTAIGKVTFNGATPTPQTCTSQATSPTGSFTCSFKVPSIAAGTYTVVLSGSDVGSVPADTASASFMVITASITLSLAQGPIGTIVTVTGTGFSINTKIGLISIARGTITSQTCTSQTTDSTGAFTCTFTVPTETLGAHIVTVSGSDVGTMPSDAASATFTVTTPTITLSPMQSPVGTSVTATGSGFSVSTAINTMTFNGLTPSVQTCTSQTTSAAGAFTCTFTVPTVTAGAYTVTVSGSDVGTVPLDTASTTFTITTPAITLSLAQGPVGTSVTVTGSGYSVLTTINTMTFNGATPTTQTCTTKTTSATGTFTCTFTVPSIASGLYTVVVSGSDVGTIPADTASATFTITTPAITLFPAQGPIGTIVTVTGTGYSVSTKIGSITIAGGTIATQTCTAQTTSATGTFTCTFTVPTETFAGHVVTVSGSDIGTVPSDTATATFTVTSPKITLTPNSGVVGTNVTVTGTGFSVLTTIGTITFGGATPTPQTCTTKTTSAAGAFTCTFIVPVVTAAAYTVTVSGSDVGTVPLDTASATFTVTAVVHTQTLTLNPTQGPVGTTVTATGANFAPLSAIKSFTFYGATITTVPATITTSAAGGFTATFVVPSLAAGAKTVTATDSSNNAASATFTITTPKITLSATQGPVGVSVTVTGSGFSVLTTIGTMTFNGATPTTQTCTTKTTSAAGAFTCTFTVPSIASGLYTVVVSGSDVGTIPADTASAPFTITTPAITLTPNQAKIGTSVTVAGSGFSAGVTIGTMTFNGAIPSGQTCTAQTTSATGTFTCTFPVPSITPGTYTVVVSGSDVSTVPADTASAPFTVIPSITLSPTQGPVGVTVTVTGSNFASFSTITIKFNGATVTTSPATVTTNAAGGFTATFVVPSSAAGVQAVTATDAHSNTGSATFTVTTPTITLSPTSGAVGTVVTVTGTGYSVSTRIGTMTFNGATPSGQTCTSQTTTAAGGFSCTFTVPTVTLGPHTVTVSGNDVGTVPLDTASATFTVTTPTITLSPAQGPVGVTVTVTGASFASSSTITIKFNGATVATGGSTAAGTFTATFVVPSTAAGAKTVTATDALSNTGSATFTVTTPAINLSPIQGPIGTSVTVTGSGFSVSTTISTMTFNGATPSGQTCTAQTTSATGTFTCTFTIPNEALGTYTTIVSGSDIGTVPADTASATFTVTTPMITLTVIQGPIGTSVTVTGSGFSVSTTISTMTFNGATPSGQTCTSQTTSATGTFTCTFTVPSIASGPYAVVLSGNDVGTVPADTASATFTVTTPTITLSPNQGLIGTSVTVAGSGFSVSTAIGTMTFNGATPSVQTCTTKTTSATGTFTCTFTVPSIASGPYAVVLSGNDVGTVPADTASATFTVTTSTINVSPIQGPDGTIVTVTGASFASSSTITIKFNGVKVTTVPATVTTSALGAFTATFVVPSSTAGAQTVTATDTSANTASATFTVTTPAITLSATQGPVGTSVTVTGSGFSVLTAIGTMTFNGATPSVQTCTSKTTSATGTFTCTFTVPAVAVGTYMAYVSGSDVGTVPADSASATFAVTTPVITLSPTQSPVGTSVTVTGSGFSVLTTIGTMTFNGVTPSGQTCTSQTTSATGTFTCTFTVPAVAVGTYGVILSGSDVGTVPADAASTTFAVTSAVITLTPIQGPEGVTVTVTGSGFSVLTTIGTMTFNGVTPSGQTCTSQTTSATGTFTCTFTVPAVAAGSYTVVLSGSDVGTVPADTGSATFKITAPTITLSVTQAPSGTSVTVAGSGFSVSTAIGTITLGGNTPSVQTCTSQTTSATGTFTCTFTVPSIAAGPYTVILSGSDVWTVSGDTASTTFTITTPTITLFPTQGPVGVTVTVTGSGFSVLTTIGTMTFNGVTPSGQTCTSKTTSATGTFTCTFTVPAIVFGPYAVVLSGSDVGTVPADSASATFTVTTPTITLSPVKGPQGTTVTVTGSGFSVLTTIGTMTFNGVTPSGQTCTSKTTSATGTFTCTFTVPADAVGTYAVVLSGSDVGIVPADSATANFKITTSGS